MTVASGPAHTLTKQCPTHTARTDIFLITPRNPHRTSVFPYPQLPSNSPLPLQEQRAKLCLPYSTSHKCHLLEILGNGQDSHPAPTTACSQPCKSLFLGLHLVCWVQKLSWMIKSSRTRHCCIRLSHLAFWLLEILGHWTEVPGCRQNKIIKKVGKKNHPKTKNVDYFPWRRNTDGGV